MDRTERFVPLRVGRLTNDLANRPWAEPDGEQQFRGLSRLVAALYHYEFHDHERSLEQAWDQIEARPEAAQEITRELTALLEAANYTRVTPDQLDEAFGRESLVPLRLEVDLDDYEELLVYRRDSSQETVAIKRYKGLRTEQRTITVEDRVVVYARVRPATWFADRDVNPSDRNLIPGSLSLKQFREVPRADIKTLLPSTQVRFRAIDSVLVGVPAVISGVVVLATKLLPTLGLIFVLAGAWLGLRDDEPDLDQGALVALIGGLITLGGFLIRQWTKLKNRRVDYLKTLSETLFFRMLGDGLGVIHTLLNAAEEQEIIEVLLAYRFLCDHPQGIGLTELDLEVEQWLAATCKRSIDFEIDDAVTKIRALGMATGTEQLQAVPMPDVLASLDARWDDLFDHRRAPLDGDAELVPVTKA